jgi:hypothetical protein
MDEVVNDLLFLVFGFFYVYFPYIQFLIMQVYSDFVKETHFDIIGVTGVMFNGVAKGSFISWVHDYSIVVTFGCFF